MNKQVTMDALIKRINRKLNKRNECLRVLRGDQVLNELGQYFITDIGASSVVAQHVDPVEIGRDLGVLKLSEEVMID